jgi:hypothetical protein
MLALMLLADLAWVILKLGTIYLSSDVTLVAGN